MKRTFSFIASALIATTACRAGAAPMTFVVEDFPPFNLIENGVVSGPIPEIVTAVCVSMQEQCNFVTYPWRRAYWMAVEGLVDGIFVLQRLPEREPDFRFTDPVVRTAFSLFAQKDAHIEYSTPCSIRGHTIGVYGPSATSAAAEQLAKSSEDVNIVLEIDNLTVLRKLRGERYGKTGIAVLNRDVGRYLIQRCGMTGLVRIGDIKDVHYSIGLSRKKVSAEQTERFNLALRSSSVRNQVKAILEKYGMSAPDGVSVEKADHWYFGSSGC